MLRDGHATTVSLGDRSGHVLHRTHCKTMGSLRFGNIPRPIRAHITTASERLAQQAKAAASDLLTIPKVSNVQRAIVSSTTEAKVDVDPCMHPSGLQVASCALVVRVNQTSPARLRRLLTLSSTIARSGAASVS